MIKNTLKFVLIAIISCLSLKSYAQCTNVCIKGGTITSVPTGTQAVNVVNTVSATVTNTVAARITNTVATTITNTVAATITNTVATTITNTVAATITNTVTATITNTNLATAPNQTVTNNTLNNLLINSNTANGSLTNISNNTGNSSVQSSTQTGLQTDIKNNTANIQTSVGSIDTKIGFSPGNLPIANILTISFEETTLSALTADVQAWLSSGASDSIIWIQYSSYGFLNVTNQKSYNCLILYVEQ